MEARVSTSNQEWIPAGQATMLKPEELDLVRRELLEILESRHFRNSRRLTSFLRYVVEKSVEGEPSLLKERLIGIELFARETDYNTSIDPTVRMAAGEVRKRLAQFYDDSTSRVVRIGLPIGSYRAQFSFSPALTHQTAAGNLSFESAAAQQEPSTLQSNPTRSITANPGKSSTLTLLWYVASGVLLICCLLGWFAWQTYSRLEEPFLPFWSPGIRNAQTLVFLCEDAAIPSEPTSLSSVDPQKELIRYSSVYSISRIQSVLRGEKIDFFVRPLSRTNYVDVQNSPTVLLASPDNQWTRLALRGARFQFGGTSDGRPAIIDTKKPSANLWYIDPHIPPEKRTIDYAIVYRTYDSGTGRWSYVFSGLTERGAFAAVRLMTNPTMFRSEILLSRDDLLKKGSIEFVVSTQVVNGVSGAGKIVAYDAP